MPPFISGLTLSEAFYREVLTSATLAERERHLAAAYEYVAHKHNALALTTPVEPETRNYYGRPFRVLHAERFAAALRAALTDERLQQPQFDKGSINQWVDSDDRVSAVGFSQSLKALYE